MAEKILVLSDSHGNLNNMLYAVRKERADLVVHLGDCWNDTDQLLAKLPDIKMRRVPGNCDWQQEPLTQIFDADGFEVMICHGHSYSVKAGLLNLQYAAQERKADVVLFGHTHKVFYDNHNGIHYLNPGSIGEPGFQTNPSYGLLYLDREKGTVRTEIIYIDE